MTMLTGQYGARHIARWSVSVASCEAPKRRHRASAWLSSSPLVKTQHKTQLLASVYRTFYLVKVVIFITRNGPPTHVIDAASGVQK
jgi:hypothetical protein